MLLIPIPAIADNCIWMVHDGLKALVAGSGNAQPVMQTLQHTGLQLDAILVTNHHAAHRGGLDAPGESKYQFK
jgi:hydroxyacylglutathione hydrolase